MGQRLQPPAPLGAPVATSPTAGRITALAAVGWLCVASVAHSATGADHPYQPDSDDQVLQVLPAEPPGAAALRQRVQGRPEDLDLALTLAHEYLRIGRRESDPRYYGYAEGVLQPWWHLQSPPEAVLLVRATVRQNRHEFGPALDDLDAVVTANPDSAQAWLTRSVILTVQGGYPGAIESCKRLARIADGLLTAACIANPASLNGNAGASYQLLHDAYYSNRRASARNRLWALTLLAEIADRLGRVDTADRHFAQARALGLRDVYLLKVYADFLLDQGRPREVVELLKTETHSDALLFSLLLAERQLRLPEARDHRQTLRERLHASAARGDQSHKGLRSRFTLQVEDRPVAALRLARANWRDQREPADTRLLLEAAIASENETAAAPVIDWLRARGTEDRHLAALIQKLDGSAGAGP